MTASPPAPAASRPPARRSWPRRLAALLVLAVFLSSLAGPAAWHAAVSPLAGPVGAQLRSDDAGALDQAVLPKQPGPEQALAEPSVRRLAKLSEAEPSPALLPAGPALEPPSAAAGRIFATLPDRALCAASARLRNRGPPSA